MALLSQLEDGILTIRSVGDQGMDEGLRQMHEAIDLARAHREATGERAHLFIDLRESEENKNATDLRHVAGFLAGHLDVLSGRIAVSAERGLRFGLARMFAVYGENVGLTTMVFTDDGEARTWLRDGGAAISSAEA